MRRCPGCGETLRRGDLRFCVACGRALEPPAAPRPEPPESRLGPRLPEPRRRRWRPTGAGAPAAGGPPRGALGTVFWACALVSVAGWIPLALPSLAINGFVAAELGLYRLCGGLKVGEPGMFACSAVVGVMTLALGPLLTIVALYLVRKRIAALLQRTLARLSAERRYLGPPIVATALFLVGWAGVHHSTPLTMGLLPNILFPVAVGAFTHWTAARAPFIQARCRGFFAVRDRLPRLLRVGLALVVPTLFALAVTVVFIQGQADLTARAVREQMIVLVGLVTGYFLLVPRAAGVEGGAPRPLGGSER